MADTLGGDRLAAERGGLERPGVERPGVERPGVDRRRTARLGPYLLSLVHVGAVNYRIPGDNFGHKARTVRISFVFDGQLTLSAFGSTEVLLPASAAMAVGWRPLELSSPGSTLLEVDIAVDSANHNLGFEDESLVVWRPETALPSATGAALRELVNHPGVVGEVRNETMRVVEQLITGLLNLRPDPKVALSGEAMERSQVLAYIAANHADPHLTPASIAERFRISTRTLHRLFESEEHTVCQVIANERLAAALSTLTHPKTASASIEDVAHRCGYGSSLAMRRAILAATGKTPSELRAEGRAAMGAVRR